MSRVETTKEQIREMVALNNNFPFGMLVGGIVVMIAGSVLCAEDCQGDGVALAVAGGTILTFSALVYIIQVYNGNLSAGCEAIFSWFFFVAWGFVTGFTTFENPFSEEGDGAVAGGVGNGFVGAWIGFIAAIGNLVYNVKFADAMKERFVNQGLYICIMIVASIVVLIATFANSCCNGDEVLALVAASVSLLFLLLRIVVGAYIDRVVAVFLAAWWMILGTIITFGAFPEIGNGYLGVWLNILGSVGLLVGAQQRHNPSFQDRFSAKYQAYNNNPKVNYNEAYNNAPVDGGYNYAQPADGGDIEKYY